MLHPVNGQFLLELCVRPHHATMECCDRVVGCLRRVPTDDGDAGSFGLLVKIRQHLCITCKSAAVLDQDVANVLVLGALQQFIDDFAAIRWQASADHLVNVVDQAEATLLRDVLTSGELAPYPRFVFVRAGADAAIRQSLWFCVCPLLAGDLELLVLDVECTAPFVTFPCAMDTTDATRALKAESSLQGHHRRHKP